MSNNVEKSDFGYEALWAKTDNYVSKILVFDSVGSGLPMHFHKETEKTWFVNTGNFKIAWIDTTDGMLYEKDVKEGSVFHVPPCMPVGLESLVDGGSITQTSNRDTKGDFFQLRPVKKED
jgi:hypothetical protein